MKSKNPHVNPISPKKPTNFFYPMYKAYAQTLPFYLGEYPLHPSHFVLIFNFII